MRETTLRRRLIAIAKSENILAIPIENVAHTGMPDMIVAKCPSCVWFVELKVGKPTLRPEQYIWFLKNDKIVNSIVACQTDVNKLELYKFPFDIKRHSSGKVTITSEPLKIVEVNGFFEYL